MRTIKRCICTSLNIQAKKSRNKKSKKRNTKKTKTNKKKNTCKTYAYSNKTTKAKEKKNRYILTSAAVFYIFLFHNQNLKLKIPMQNTWAKSKKKHLLKTTTIKRE